MNVDDARDLLAARLVGLVVDRLLMDGRLSELTVLAGMSAVELDVLAVQEHEARACVEPDVWQLLLEWPTASVAVIA